MNRMRSVILSALFLGIAGACNSPAAPELSTPAEARPTYNIGYTYGSGATAAAPDPETTAATDFAVADDSVTKRGGYTYGSGN